MHWLYIYLGTYDQNQRVQDFRTEYLVHGVMVRATADLLTKGHNCLELRYHSQNTVHICRKGSGDSAPTAVY